jgi:hypothetical protein
MIDLGDAEARAAIRLLELAIKQGWFDKLRDALKRKHTVLILGSTGTGKTNFVQSLTEIVPKAISHMNRTEFVKTHAIKIAKEPFNVIDTPGQVLHSSRRVKAIREAIGKGAIGVINVVSYGYHEGRTARSEALTARGRIKESFLERNRRQELLDLDDWKVLLGGPETTKWLVTVVTKADLWWSQRSDVLDHYQTGPYYRALGPARSLNPSVMEYCSVFHKFYGEGPLSGLFDEQDRVDLRAHLLRELLAAVAGAK